MRITIASVMALLAAASSLAAPSVSYQTATNIAKAVSGSNVSALSNALDSAKQDRLPYETNAIPASAISNPPWLTSHQDVSGKQDALSPAQTNAVNSGITSSKVSAYDGYATGKQDKLESGVSIKTVNNQSLLGSGNIEIQGGTGQASLSKIHVEDVTNSTGSAFGPKDIGAVPTDITEEVRVTMSEKLELLPNGSTNGIRIAVVQSGLSVSVDTNVTVAGIPHTAISDPPWLTSHQDVSGKQDRLPYETNAIPASVVSGAPWAEADILQSWETGDVTLSSSVGVSYYGTFRFRLTHVYERKSSSGPMMAYIEAYFAHSPYTQPVSWLPLDETFTGNFPGVSVSWLPNGYGFKISDASGDVVTMDISSSQYRQSDVRYTVNDTVTRMVPSWARSSSVPLYGNTVGAVVTSAFPIVTNSYTKSDVDEKVNKKQDIIAFGTGLSATRGPYPVTHAFEKMDKSRVYVGSIPTTAVLAYSDVKRFNQVGRILKNGDSFTFEDMDEVTQPATYAGVVVYGNASVSVDGSYIDGKIESMSNNLDTAISSRVPSDRKVNNKPLSSDVTLAVGDIAGGTYVSNKVETTSQTVVEWSTYWDGDDVRVTVTNYNSATRKPELYLEQKITDDPNSQTNYFKVIWKEMTWLNWLKDEWIPTNFYTKAQMDSELDQKADRAWGFYDSHSGELSPEGYTQISSSNIMIAANMSYQKTVTTDGAIWVLTSTGVGTQMAPTTNGFFRISDDKQNSLFEIRIGDKHEIGADADGVTTTEVSGKTHLHITYSVVSESHPKVYVASSLSSPSWKGEEDAGFPCTVSWTGSSGNWQCEIYYTGSDMGQLFVKAGYMVGGDTMIRNVAPVEMQYLYLNGHKYSLGTAVISGNTVLTLTLVN